MGLLAKQSGLDDIDRALMVADSAAKVWNEDNCKEWGITAYVDPAMVQRCCLEGQRLFECDFFPDPPGPFKRVAAFVVLGRLYPFYIFEGPEAPQSQSDTPQWLARFMTFTVPGVLAQTRVLLDTEKRLLTDFLLFPSPHYLLEFLAWLRWMDSFDRHRPRFTDEEWRKFSLERLARMVMGTALILESCYYINFADRRTSTIQSRVSGCLSNLTSEQELDLCFFTGKLKA